MLAWLGSGAVGVGCALAVGWVLRALATDALEQKQDDWRYDVSRINALREQDTLFRLFQKPIQFLAKLNRSAFPRQLPGTIILPSKPLFPRALKTICWGWPWA